IAVFDWEGKRALLVGPAHALPFALADRPVEHQAFRAPADAGEERAYQRLAGPGPRQRRQPDLDGALAGIPEGSGDAGLAGRAARHHLTSRAGGQLKKKVA